MDLTAKVFHGLPDQIRTTLSMSNELIANWATSLDLIRLSRFIVSGTIGRQAEAEAVKEWIRREIEYRNDPAGHEMIQDPIVTLAEKAGDCDDMTILAGALLAAIGHDCRAVGIIWKGQTDPSHEVLLDTTARVVVDPVSSVACADWPPAGYEVSQIVEA